VTALPKGLLPSLAPIRQTLALAFKFAAVPTHSSATSGAHTIQNAGYYVRIRFNCVPPACLHTHSSHEKSNDQLPVFHVLLRR